MAFVNDYLSDEEKEMFRQRAIPKGLWWNGGFLGVNPYSKITCTLDREAKIYLFDLGRFHDAENLDEHNFRLVWDFLARDEAIYITARKQFPTLSEINNERVILWHSLELGIPQNLKQERDSIIAKFKEALTAFGLNGDPERPVLRNATFDF